MLNVCDVLKNMSTYHFAVYCQFVICYFKILWNVWRTNYSWQELSISACSLLSITIGIYAHAA